MNRLDNLPRSAAAIPTSTYTLHGMHRFALALALTLLGGCVEYRESLVLERNESGTVVMAIGVDEALMRAAEVAETGLYDLASVADTLRALHGLQVVESRTETGNGRRWLHLTLAFESLAALNGIDRLEQYRGLFGNVTLTENPAGQPVLTRTIRVNLRAKAGQSILPSLIAPMLGGYPWSYEARFPTKILDSNGEIAVSENDAGVVRWRFDLGEIVTEPRVMRTTFARPGVGPAGIGVGAALMLIGIAAAWIMQKRRNRVGTS